MRLTSQTSKWFSLAIVILETCARSPPVKVALRSSWPAPPLLLEIIETAALENPGAFFPLVDILTNPDILPSPYPSTSEAIHAFALAAAEGYLSKQGHPTFLTANLALHASTPKIEAFYQYYIDHDLDAWRVSAAKGAECGSWVDWYGEVVCDIETLVQLAGKDTVDSAENSTSSPSPKVKTLAFDHIQPSPSNTLEHPRYTAVLYASLSSQNFRDLHSYLLSLSTGATPKVVYIMRHIPPSDRGLSERNILSGYGVSLDLKKMDYLALDDRHGHRGSNANDIAEDSTHALSDETDHILQLLRKYPVNDTAAEANVPHTEDELLLIGFQSAQLIRDSSTPLETLRELSQNFPKYATTISRRVTIDQALEEEVKSNHEKASPGINMVWLNGAIVDEKYMDPYALLRLLRKERSIILSLTSLGLTPSQAIELLSHPTVSAAQSDKGVMDALFDASDRPEEGGAIVWWNDIEKDRKYAGWTPSLQTLLRPMYPGQFPNVRLNLFNIVLVLDLSQTSALQFIAGSLSSIINRGFPFRFGLVPITENEEGTQMARIFCYLVEYYGRARTMRFLQNIARSYIPPHLVPTVDWALVRSEFEILAVSPPDEHVPPSFDAIVRGTSNYSVELDRGRVYADRLEATLASAPRGHAFINGKHFDMDDAFLRNMQVELGLQLQYLQESLYTGKLSEDTAGNISTYFYDMPTTAMRRNRHIYPSSTVNALRIISFQQLYSRVGILSHGRFIYPRRRSGSGVVESEPVVSTRVPFTVYVVADLDSEAGLALAKEALDSLKEDSLARISFIHNPANQELTGSHTSLLISYLVHKDLLSKLSPNQLLQALGLASVAVDGDDVQTVLSQERTLREITGGVALADLDVEVFNDYMRSSRLLVRELRLDSGDQAVVVNGRVVGPIEPGELVAADFEALLSYELRKRTGPVVEALANIKPSVDSLDQDTFVHFVSMASSIISASQIPDSSETGLFDVPPRARVRNYRFMDGAHTAFEFGDNSTALFQLGVLLDPLSETAQKWSSLLDWLRTLPGVSVDLHINPSQYTELPLKRFYRYNIIDSLSFNTDGSEHSSQAVFNGLPVDPIYTLGMDVPPSWLVRPREAMYDLDNIQLGALSPDDRVRGMEAVFDLDFLVVEGHARDPQSNAPPRGVQVQLINGNGTSVDDTQIVATLGYLQFKITPGVFQLEIREGRGRDIFKLESVGNEGWESLTVEEAGNEIALTSFEGLTLYPRLARQLGMETEDVLIDIAATVEEPPSLIADVVSRISSIFTSQETALVLSGSAQADINIFTVASGLLYERFVSIMILSVLRNTKSSVKFWFIENFLSPSFLEFIPHLAEAYKFQYELVTYKWPSWLRPQKEKQRIIWAYKILFLDVLFPMDLKKVIFVDADQIVRADLQELVDLDLHGAPYGYTPMGDDNPDMEGFRFWKTGYWKEFLLGRPYHISALYVIDLVKFRQIAAGDILRQQYHALSADPNSLANLDQDLPNNLQREVPIYSLHEDWLWCETWCSKDRLHRAKTIDLCQNPLTKEPKLARARAIPEWEEYDSEISRFARKLAEDGLIRSNIVAVDVNVLANVGASSVVDTRDKVVLESKETSPSSDSDSQVRDEL